MSVKQNLNKELKSALDEDEVLIWSNYPKQSFQIGFEDLIIIPFLSIIIFIGTYICFKILYINTNKGLILFSIFPIAIFILMVYFRYIQKINIQKKTIYGLTSKRVIIIADNKTSFLNLNDIKEISFVEHPFNFKYGSIIFGEPENIFGSSNDNKPFTFSNVLGNRGGINLKRDDFAFDFICNTKAVYNLIKATIKK